MIDQLDQTEATVVNLTYHSIITWTILLSVTLKKCCRNSLKSLNNCLTVKMMPFLKWFNSCKCQTWLITDWKSLVYLKSLKYMIGKQIWWCKDSKWQILRIFFKQRFCFKLKTFNTLFSRMKMFSCIVSNQTKFLHIYCTSPILALF